MRRIGILILTSAMLCGVAGTALAAKAHCPELSVYLEGSTTFMGVIGTQRLTMHRVSGGKGYDGKWLIDELEQQGDYPRDLPWAPPIFARADMGNGMWMNSFFRQVGPRTTLITSTGGNTHLDVVGGRVGWAATGNFTGSISGDVMTFTFGGPLPMPVLKGTIMRGGKAPDIELTLSILNDAGGGKFRYSTDKPAVLKLELEARVTPPERAGDVQWTLPEIEGSEPLVQPTDARGPHVTVTYKKLPERNDSFGEKTVSARLRAGTCKAEESKTIKVFYPSTAVNNPGGQDPNWFYYWSQTPAAKPRGHQVQLEYGGHPYSFCHWEGAGTAGFFAPNHHKHRTAYICNLTQIGGASMSNRFPLLSRTPAPNITGRLDGWRTTTFIDTFATTVMHENEHILMYEMWKMGKTLARLEAEDGDRDGVPDAKEPGFGFDPTKMQTWLNAGDTAKIKYDEEWLAFEAMRGHQPGSLDKYDWASPGKQWP